MLKDAYLLANIGADTAENEQHFAEILPIGRRVADRGAAPLESMVRAGFLPYLIRFRFQSIEDHQPACGRRTTSWNIETFSIHLGLSKSLKCCKSVIRHRGMLIKVSFHL